MFIDGLNWLEWNLNDLLNWSILFSLINHGDFSILVQARLLKRYALAHNGVFEQYLDILDIWSPPSVVPDDPPDPGIQISHVPALVYPDDLSLLVIAAVHGYRHLNLYYVLALPHHLCLLLVDVSREGIDWLSVYLDRLISQACLSGRLHRGVRTERSLSLEDHRLFWTTGLLDSHTL
jgi:hypothetical protein